MYRRRVLKTEPYPDPHKIHRCPIVTFEKRLWVWPWYRRVMTCMFGYESDVLMSGWFDVVTGKKVGTCDSLFLHHADEVYKEVPAEERRLKLVQELCGGKLEVVEGRSE